MASGRFVCAVVLVVVPLLLSTASALDFSRVHLVDQSPKGSGYNNFLFRGDMPTITNTTTGKPEFAYDELIGYMRERANESGVTLPDDLYMVDVSLNNVFDGADFAAEEAFWKGGAHASLGEFINWPLGLAGILPPCIYPDDKRYSMANSSVWKVDKIPERIEILHGMLTQSFPKSAVIYVHCSAGCDRTGEVIGSYILWYQSTNLTAMYAEDTHDCGRPPNYFSTSALEWFCYYVADQRGKDSIGDCCGFAKCKLFGKCTPTGSGLTDAAYPGAPASSPFHTRLVQAATRGTLGLPMLQDASADERHAAFTSAAQAALGLRGDA